MQLIKKETIDSYSVWLLEKDTLVKGRFHGLAHVQAGVRMKYLSSPLYGSEYRSFKKGLHFAQVAYND